ncbi:MAG TPA: phosphoglucosamine mutase [Candidatus Saccharimonadales bacterium]|nr:phosphoglucosamine mutase [Candidatus Saccharimonadales bacterium]
MSSQLFGTDGIRGPAGTYPLDHAGMVQIGKAVATYFAQPGDLILVGWDPRESSPVLVDGVVEGLVAAGAAVRKIGVVPTPGLAYLTKQRRAVAGVMITASHNPYSDNGVKVFTPDGRKLPDEVQTGLNQLISGDTIATRPGGSVSDDSDAAQAYEDFLVSAAEGASFDALRLAVDTANGATSGIAARVFERLGAHVTALFDQPDGKNINVRCGATDPAALQAAVREQQLSAGAAFDGDGDRLVLVDEQGRQLTGDHILYILAVSSGYDGVVATVMSNGGLERALKKHHIALQRTAVGDRSVLAGMQETGFRLGGEQSGHIIIPQYNSTGDGLVAAIRTLIAVNASGKTLGTWYDELSLLPQALVNIPLSDKSALNHPTVQKFVESQTAELGDSGRLLIRPSGTEPKARIMVEAPDAEKRARDIAATLTKLTSSPPDPGEA